MSRNTKEIQERQLKSCFELPYRNNKIIKAMRGYCACFLFIRKKQTAHDCYEKKIVWDNCCHQVKATV